MTISSPRGTATAQAAPNIAFIKYWGNPDNTLRIPMNRIHLDEPGWIVHSYHGQLSAILAVRSTDHQRS